MFGTLATANPQDAKPKLGYALAAALRGDDAVAARAMARVHRFDETVLEDLYPGPALSEAIDGLIERYGYQETEEAELLRASLKRIRGAPEDEATESAR